jgi:hypothetical protein
MTDPSIFHSQTSFPTGLFLLGYSYYRDVPTAGVSQMAVVDEIAG